MANSVQVVGNGEIIGTRSADNITFYGWSFNVIVNGQAGIYVLWIDTPDPSAQPQIIQDVIDNLTADPDSMSGVAMNDSGTDQGDRGDDQGGGQGGDQGGDDDDGVLADGGTGDPGGDSV